MWEAARWASKVKQPDIAWSRESDSDWQLRRFCAPLPFVQWWFNILEGKQGTGEPVKLGSNRDRKVENHKELANVNVMDQLCLLDTWQKKKTGIC